ncbi:MAG TPA: prepilin-type N-terminal cleavage/methylation domain-containing protein [Gemmatimonadota bacterium]|nr:prepilin-type N-terminal cleavage/methylation domain-containing protein [Gemmatimonadota bacterium]
MRSRGETLVEIVVALLLLTVGALALAGAIGQAQQARHQAASSGLALASAEAWLEAWRAGPHRGAAAATEAISWGEWRGVMEWQTGLQSECVESAQVSVRAEAGEPGVRLSSRRFLPSGGVCAP